MKRWRARWSRLEDAKSDMDKLALMVPMMTNGRLASGGLGDPERVGRKWFCARWPWRAGTEPHTQKAKYDNPFHEKSDNQSLIIP